MAKLTQRQVDAVRDMYRYARAMRIDTKGLGRDLSKAFHVSDEIIYGIIAGKRWKGFNYKE